MPKPVTAAKQKKIKDWLKAKGRAKTAVDRLKMDTDTDVIRSVVDLHGLTLAQYKSGGLA